MTTEISQQDYRRDLGLMEATSIVIGRIIGSGIFRTPGPIMALVGSTALFGFTWVLGGIVTIFGAVIYAELVAMLPKSGGPYVYLKEAYHPVVPFLRGWAMFFVSETGAIAAVSLVFAEYLNALVVTLGNKPLPHSIEIVIALGTLWLLTFINSLGVYFSGKVQNFFSTIKVVAVFGIIAAALSSTQGSLLYFTTDAFPRDWSWSTVLAVGAALRYAFFAFSGWEGSTYVAEEVMNPSRNLPLALLLGISGVMLLYAGANGAYLYLLPPSVIMESKWVATDAMKVALGSAGGIFISAAVMINTFGNVSTQVLVKARTWHAMARDGMFFQKLKYTSERFKTPNNSLLAQGLWASVLLVFAGFAANTYETIIDFFSATSTIFNLLTFYSIVVLRKKFPDMHRPYRAWLYPWSVWIIMALYSAFLVITLVTAFIPSLVGMVLTGSGLIYYYLVVAKRIDRY